MDNMKKEILITIGITILFLGTCITPTVAIDTLKKPSNPISSGNTLYVGGSGEGNYSTINDAIKNASDGDTVFVYSGTYFENLTVDKSINITGENKNSTIIDAKDKINSITIIVDWVNINNFSIKNADCSGIYIKSDYNTIENNIISTKLSGYKAPDGIYLFESNNNKILRNKIINNRFGVTVLFSNNNTILRNTIISNDVYGIELGCSNCNMIIGNNISSNLMRGLFIYKSCYNIILSNNINKNGDYGIQFETFNYGNHIYMNNLINNGINAYFYTKFFEINRNNWKGNYWSDYKDIFRFPKLIKGKIFPTYYSLIFIPTFALDWRPAKEPYDI